MVRKYNCPKSKKHPITIIENELHFHIWCYVCKKRYLKEELKK